MPVNLKNFFVGRLTNADVALYTPAAAGVSGRIVSASALNTDTVDHLIDIYIVPSGGAGAAAEGNQVYSEFLIPAGQSIDLTLLRGKNIIGAGGPGSLVGKADAANFVTLTVSGVELS